MKSYRQILDERNEAFACLEIERAGEGGEVDVAALTHMASAYSEAEARHVEALMMLGRGVAK